MIQTHAYSTDPTWGTMPAPVLPICIGTPYDFPTSKIPTEALVDSGAGMSGIPLSMVEQLKLVQSGERPIATPVGKYQVKVYAAVFEVKGRAFWVSAIGLGLPFPVIGRDVLNAFKVCLDGPHSTLEISHD